MATGGRGVDGGEASITGSDVRAMRWMHGREVRWGEEEGKRNKSERKIKEDKGKREKKKK